MRLQSPLNAILLGAIVAPPVLPSQTSFRYPLDDADVFLPRKPYELEWPVKRVAIIGAGVGGMIAYQEFKRDNFDVHVFERDYLPGGTWHYTEETPLDAPIPNAPIAIADFEPSLPPQGVSFPYSQDYDDERFSAFQRRVHRAPKPTWYGLTTNVPAPIQEIRGFPWPDGTEWAIPQAKVGRYLRAFASWHNINSNDNTSDISYNTRVELIEKRFDSTQVKQIGWTLTTRELIKIEGGRNRVTWRKQDFDAVAVVSGRYNAPDIPSMEGLENWARQFPERIVHSRQYRHPEAYAGKTVLIVGTAASGSQISREIDIYAANIYQSVRSTHPTRQIDWLRRVPLNVSLVAEVKRFQSPLTTIQESTIELVDGTLLSGVDYILFATGYLYTYPFLPEYHNPTLGRTGDAPEDGLKPIVTDGTHLRSLHLDTFYIDNPTLAFVNANQGIPAFRYAEFQSLAISMVWAGKAHLPSRAKMWDMYYERVREFGYGKQLSFLGKRSEGMFRFFRGWLNAAAAKSGGRQINGFPAELSQIDTLWFRALFGDPWLVRNITLPGAEHLYDNVQRVAGDVHMYDIVFNDYW